MKQLKSLSIYGFTIFFNAAISFVTFSLVTHHLTEVDYGIINLYSATIVFLSPFIAIGVQFILGVDFFKMSEDVFSRHFTNAISIPVISCFFFTLLILVGHSYIENFLRIDFFFALLIPFACLLTIYNDVILTLIRDKGNHRLFSLYSISKNIVEIALTILFVVMLSLKWQGRLSSSIAVLCLMLAVAIFLVKRWKLYTGVFNKDAIKKIFITGLPFVPERLAIFVLGFSDRFFINFYEGTGDVGLYSAGAQIAMIVSMGTLTLSNVFYPTIYKSLAQTEVDYAKLRKIILVYIGIASFIALSVILATPLFFKYFIGPRFNPGKQYAIFLTIGLFFWAVYNVFIAFLLSLRKNNLIMSISIFGMIVSLSINLFFVRWFGALGATYTSMIVHFIMAVTTIYFVNKYYSLSRIFGFKNLM
jgi:O-antigen/teichoic acid export membrane protein